MQQTDNNDIYLSSCGGKEEWQSRRSK